MQTASKMALLALSFGFVFLWQATPLSLYTIQTLIALIAIYFILSFRRKKGIISFEVYNPFSIFIINTILVLLVFATGGFSSPIFFLLYFLGFGVSFSLKPPIVFVFILGIILLFLPLALKDDVARNLLMLGSLIGVSTIAVFFGGNQNSQK